MNTSVTMRLWEHTEQQTLDGAPVSLPATTHAYLARSMDSLVEALAAADAPSRYAHAHGAALRAAAAFLAARTLPTTGRKRQRSAWVLLSEVAPELGDWAVFFAAGATKRAAAEAGSTRAVDAGEADDLVRDSDRFLAVIEHALGLTPHPPMSTALVDSGAQGGVQARRHERVA